VNTFRASKPGVHRADLGDALDHQPRGDEQPARERDLEHDEGLAERPILRLVEPRASSLSTELMSARDDCTAGSTPRGERGDEAERDREEEDRRVEADVEPGRRVGVEDGAVEQRDARVRQPHAERRGERGDDQRLGEELPHDGEAGRAERGADPHLLGAVRGAVEQEVGDVGAGDQQDQAHRAEHREEELPRLRAPARPP
jgi:hypothetical protein